MNIIFLALHLYGTSQNKFENLVKLSLHKLERSNSSFDRDKKQLIELLAEGLLRVFTNAPCEKKLVITSQGKCSVQVHLRIKTLSHGMSTAHEETDVIIRQQGITAIEDGATSVKVTSDDTDVFVLLLHFYIEQSLSTTVFLKGTSSNRNVFYVTAACQSLVFAAKMPVATFGRSKCRYILCYSRRENVYCC